MRHKIESLRRWLAAERAQQGEAAEHALREIFRLLEDPHAPAGFATTVLRRLDARPVPALPPVPLRWAVAAAMIAAALSLAVLPVVLAALSKLVEVGSLVELTGAALVGASQALASWLALWQSLAEVSGILLGIVSRPQVVMPLLGILAISVVALKLFSSLMASDRSTGYA